MSYCALSKALQCAFHLIWGTNYAPKGTDGNLISCMEKCISPLSTQLDSPCPTLLRHQITVFFFILLFFKPLLVFYFVAWNIEWYLWKYVGFLVWMESPHVWFVLRLTLSDSLHIPRGAGASSQPIKSSHSVWVQWLTANGDYLWNILFYWSLWGDEI